jgi:exo-1,4-beta-D-glucosaminidase
MWLNGSDNPPPPDVEQMYLNIEKQLLWPNPVVSSATGKTTSVTGHSGVKMTGPYEYVAPSYWEDDTPKGHGDGKSCNPGGCGGAYGFNTETSMGPAVPPVDSIRAMVGNDHLWPIDEVWNYHAGGGEFKNIKVFTDALETRYGKASGVEDFAEKSQLQTYEEQISIDRRDPVDAEQCMAVDDLAFVRLLFASGGRIFWCKTRDGSPAPDLWIR